MSYATLLVKILRSLRNFVRNYLQKFRDHHLLTMSAIEDSPLKPTCWRRYQGLAFQYRTLVVIIKGLGPSSIDRGRGPR